MKMPLLCNSANGTSLRAITHSKFMVAIGGLPIGLVRDCAIEAWYHPSIAWLRGAAVVNFLYGFEDLPAVSFRERWTASAPPRTGRTCGSRRPQLGQEPVHVPFTQA